MNLTRAAEQFRRDADERRSLPPVLRYTPSLRVRAVTYWHARRAEGATKREITTELGVDRRTLNAWLGAAKVGPVPVALARVELVAEPRILRSLEVYGPRGLRIEGLDVEGLASLLERLG